MAVEMTRAQHSTVRCIMREIRFRSERTSSFSWRWDGLTVEILATGTVMISGRYQPEADGCAFLLDQSFNLIVGKRGGISTYVARGRDGRLFHYSKPKSISSPALAAVSYY